MYKRVLAGIGCFIALSLNSAHAADRAEAVDPTTLRVCADPDAPPFSSQDGKGFENKIAELYARQLGLPVSYTWFPNIVGFFRQTLNARRCDLVIGTATGNDVAVTTIPYYRSTYVLVTRSADAVAAANLDDPMLKSMTIGVQVRTPPSDVLSRQGMLGNMRTYDLMVDSRLESVGRRMITDLAARRIDAAVMWGPIGAYFASQHAGLFRVTPLPADIRGVPMAFNISMALRFGEPLWKARTNQFIRDNRSAIREILMKYDVPLLPLEEERH